MVVFVVVGVGVDNNCGGGSKCCDWCVGIDGNCDSDGGSNCVGDGGGDDRLTIEVATRNLLKGITYEFKDQFLICNIDYTIEQHIIFSAPQHGRVAGICGEMRGAMGAEEAMGAEPTVRDCGGCWFGPG